jgi:hypothetical protein
MKKLVDVIQVICFGLLGYFGCLTLLYALRSILGRM